MILAHFRRVEPDLDLHILRDREERRKTGSVTSTFARFRERIDVGIVAVAGIRETLQQLIIDVAHVPKPRAVRATPVTRCALGDVDERLEVTVPTLKSPSVASTTRLIPSLMNVSCASLIRPFDALRSVGRSEPPA